MSVTIFAVTTRIPGGCNDGRDTAIFWGHEKQYHATRETAEASCQRLNDSHVQGCDEPPLYDVEEFSRETFETGTFGDKAWRSACREAGVDPATGLVHAVR